MFFMYSTIIQQTYAMWNIKLKQLAFVSNIFISMCWETTDFHDYFETYHKQL